MLPPHLRLPTAVRILHPRVFHYPFFRIFVWENNLPLSRFAVTVSNRIDKRATARNRYRRIIVSTIQDQLSLFPTGLDVRISFKGSPVNEDELSPLMQKALEDIKKQFRAKEKKT